LTFSYLHLDLSNKKKLNKLTHEIFFKLHFVLIVNIGIIAQSRTGGVLGAVPSAAIMGARRIFLGGGGKFKNANKLTTFRYVVTLKTQVFTVTTNVQNTLKHI